MFGVVGAAMILGEQMSEREYLGCAIVFVAILISQFDVFECIKRLKNRSKDN